MELVRAVFNRAIDHELFPGPNPALRMEMNKKVARDRRLMPGEIEAFFQALEEHSSELMRDYVYLSLFTSQR